MTVMPHPNAIYMVLLPNHLLHGEHQPIKTSDDSKGGGDAHAKRPAAKHEYPRSSMQEKRTGTADSPACLSSASAVVHNCPPILHALRSDHGA